MFRYVAPLSAALTALPAAADGPCAADAMIVFDGSASMGEISLETGNTTRITEARQAIARALPQVEPFRDIGLLTYGPGGVDSCAGLTLHFPPRPLAAEATQAAVDGLVPGGLTPLSDAVEAAAEVLAYRSQPAVVVLVTDGNETCGGTPCATSVRMADEAADLTVHVIGFRVTRDFFAWDSPEARDFAGDTVARCFADTTGGLFVATETVDELVAALNQTLGCAFFSDIGPALLPRIKGSAG